MTTKEYKRHKVFLNAFMLFVALGASAILCEAQQPPTNDPVESFVIELARSSAQRRTQLLAERTALVTVDLRKALINRGNLNFSSARYATAVDIYQLAEKVARQLDDKEGLATAALNIASVYYFQGQHDLAIDRYRAAESLFTSLGKRADAARARAGLGLTYQAQQKPIEALQSLEHALKEFEALKDINEIPNTLASIGSIQYEMGNYDAAAKSFLKIRDWSESGENLIRIADAFYMQYEYSQALVYYKSALNFFQQRRIVAGMIGATAGAGHCYYNQRDYDEALNYYKRGLALEEQLKDQSGIATRLLNIGNVYRAQGDYASALESYERSLKAAAEAQTPIANTLGNIGLVRALQGNNAQAIEYFDKSLKEFETTGEPVGMARMLSLIGNTRYVQGMYDLALEAYEKSRALHESRGDLLNQAHVLVGIGTVFLNKKQYGPALKSYQQALNFYEKLGRNVDVADVLTRVASAYRLQDDNTKSLEAADRAIKLARKTNAPAILSYALTEAGKAHHGRKRPNEALVAFDEAIRLQLSLRGEVGPEGFEAERSGVLPYLGAMETFIDQNNTAKAFERAEGAKTQFLFELIQQGNFTITRDLTPQEQTEERRLIGELISLKLQMSRIQGASSVQAARLENIRNRANTAQTALQAFRRGLQLKHPQLKVNRGELAPFTLESTRALLTNNTALIEYAITDDKVLLWVITRNPNFGMREWPLIKMYSLSLGRADLARLTKRFQELIATRDNAAPEVARELYDVLLKPAEEQLAGKAKFIIVPDGVLWEIPFEALQKEDRYLIDRASISYAISLAALKEMHQRVVKRRAGPATLLAFGSPVLPECCAIQRVQTLYKGMDLNEISSEAPEIEKLQTANKDPRSRFYTGAEAQKSRVTSEVKNYDALHLGTPAILDHRVPMQSQMIFSPEAGSADDGVLKLWEVTKLNSKAQVVVLSHSTFAQRDAQSGNALIALNWAWFVAGTPAVILSRWETEPAGVADFMTELHRGLRQSKNSHAQTLRESVLKLRRSPERENPYHWSGFILLGGRKSQ